MSVKDLKGYEGLYDITTYGEIFSKRNGKKLKKTSVHNGYYRVNLTKEKKHKMHFVHRLVAETFIPNPENKPFINHIDGNPRNNRVSNLEWCTTKENSEHAVKNSLYPSGMDASSGKFTNEQILFIRECYSAGYSQRKLARIFSVSHFTIKLIVENKSYSEVPNSKPERYSPQITEIIKKLLQRFSWQEVAEMTGLDRERIRNIWGTPHRTRNKKESL